jgi:hypothetical protein
MAILFVRNGGTNSTKSTVTSLSVTVPAGGHAAGNLVVLFVGYTTIFSPTVTATDSKGNTWVQLGWIGQNNSSWAASAIFASQLATALLSGDTITFTNSTQTFTQCALNSAEFSGVSVTTDVSNTAAVSATSSTTTPALASNLTTTNTSDLALAVVGLPGPIGDTFTNDAATWDGSTWTALPRVGSTGGSAASNATVNSAYLITTATGALNYKPTLGTARSWAEIVATLKAAVPAGPLPAGLLGHRQPARDQRTSRQPSRGRF